MRALALMVAAAGAAILVGSASAIESTIYPGVGIGKVRLGMTASQVKKALGADYLVNRHQTIRGKRYVEYGWDFSRWAVTFEQRPRALRVVQVATVVWSQRTTKQVGPGTLWRKLVHAYPRGQCGWGNNLNAFGGVYLEYLVPHEGDTQTLYTLDDIHGDKADPSKVTNWRVLEVRVRTRFETLPEFGAQRLYRCSDGWRYTNVPTAVKAP